MIVYRLSKEIYCRDLSGKGAEKAGGRWNSKGIAMLYTSDSRSLCTTEIAVHTPLGIVPIDYSLTTIKCPDEFEITTINRASIPPDWKSFPFPHSTQILGDQFIRDRHFLVLKVASAVIQGDFNYLFNPTHAAFSELKILNTEPLGFDKRLFKR